MFKTKNCIVKFIILLGFIQFFSCNPKRESKINKTPIVLRDSSNSEEFLYNESEQKWKRNLSERNKLDSIQKEIVSLDKQGNVFRDKAFFKNALTYHFKALQLAEEIDDTVQVITILNDIGTDLRRTLSNVEASKYHFRALELARENPKNLKSKAIAMNGLGNIFLALDNQDEAEKYFKQSLQIEIELHSDLGQAINYANYGDVMKMKGDLDAALNFYEKSLKKNENINSNIGIAICKNSIGLIFLKQNKVDEALTLLREAEAILKDSPDAFHKITMQFSLCKSLISLNLLKEAEKSLEQIFETLKKVNSLENKQVAYELLTLLNKKQGNFERALETKEIAIAYQDSTLTQNNEVKILEIENRYKNKQAIQQIKYLVKEKSLIEKSTLNQQRIFVLLFLLMSSVIGFTYYMYRNRKKVTQELSKINQMKSRFFGNVSHEFRTPITLIKGPLEKMLEGKLPKHQKKEVEMMYKNANRLLHLVNQILNLSKIGAGKFNIKVKKANLSNEIKGISQSFNYLEHSKAFEYLVNVEDSGDVWFDEEIVEMLLTNLLSNAFKFTPKNGSIILKGIKKEKVYEIILSNSVENITDKDLNLFFSRFYSKSNPAEQEGTGIGLSLVKELCTLYKAKIEVVKTDNHLIAITVKFPIDLQHFKFSETNKDFANEKLENNFNVNESVIDKKTNTKKKSIDKDLLLIVEDNTDMRQYIASIFEDKYEILEAKDGKEGINLALNYIPNIIISDVMMPKIGGIELCKVLKSDLNTNHIPIILLTATNDETIMFKGLDENADDFIIKPFAIKVLKSKVNNLINTRKTLANKYRGEIVLKPVNELLKWGNNSFSDTLKHVLEHYITNPEFNVEEFCGLANMSRTQLHRKLRATTGMSSTEFIRVHRLKIASELMKNKNLSVSDVCYASGFSNTSYFSKQFKELFKMSPKEYKESI